jgi:hypothetical protein
VTNNQNSPTEIRFFTLIIAKKKVTGQSTGFKILVNQIKKHPKLKRLMHG